jgi:hypothetical protein
MTLIRAEPELDTSILPIYQEYLSSAPGIGLWTYLNMRADYDLAVAFSKLYWPDFVEVDDCVFLAEHFFPNNYAQWWKDLDGDKKRIEAMINLTAIWDLFMNSGAILERSSEEVDKLYSHQLYVYLGEVLVVCWKQALSKAFPNRQFVMDYSDTIQDYGPTITFYQEHV